jgi:hypothetical protein
MDKSKTTKPGGEITSMLQTFGIQPDGAIADLEEVPGLDQTGYELGHTLRDILAHKHAHKHAQSHDKKTWGKYDAAVYDLLQEQSFTVLNRLCALRMAEERGLILPCVSQGINSDGLTSIPAPSKSPGSRSGCALRRPGKTFRPPSAPASAARTSSAPSPCPEAMKCSRISSPPSTRPCLASW